MGAISVAYRSELRRRWRSWLSIALLIAVVGGVALAAGAAGRRTGSAFPDYVARHGYDAVAYATAPVPHIGRLPNVVAWSDIVGPDNGPARSACAHPIPANDFGVAVVTGGSLSPEVLVSGRQPDPSSPDEVLASYTMAQQVGLHLGSVVRVPFYARSQAAAYDNGVPPAPKGPTVALRVVGFSATETDFPNGGAPQYFLFATKAFLHRYGSEMGLSYGYFVRLRGGASGVPRFEAASSSQVLFVENADDAVSAVEASIHP